MRTAAILYNVLHQWYHLETDYTKTEAYWNALIPDLLDCDAGADGENLDFVLDFIPPTQCSAAITIHNLLRYKHCCKLVSNTGLDDFISCKVISLHTSSINIASVTCGGPKG